MSTFLERNTLHSLLVISLTVVKQSAFMADNFSSDCLETTPNSLDFISGLYFSISSYNGKPFPAIDLPKTVACVVKTVASCGAFDLIYKSPLPVIHS